MNKKTTLFAIIVIAVSVSIFLQNTETETETGMIFLEIGEKIPETEYYLGRISSTEIDGKITEESVYLYPNNVSTVIFPENIEEYENLPDGSGRAIKLQKGVFNTLQDASVGIVFIDNSEYTVTLEVFSI